MKISVLIPVYNVKPYLDECIESVFANIRTDVEMILVDDGSADGSSELCDAWAAKDPRIRVHHQTNQGVSAARNKAMDLAQGDYLYFIDGDDRCLCPFFDEMGENDMLVAGFQQGRRKVVPRKKAEGTDNPALSFLKEDVRCCMGSFVFKTSLVRENDIRFDKKYTHGEDLEFMLKLFLVAKSVKIYFQPVLDYRVVPTSAMRKVTFKRFDIYFSRRDLIPYCTEKGNAAAADYLENYSCVEAIVVCARELSRSDVPARELKTFLSQHPDMGETLRKGAANTSLPSSLRSSAARLVRSPWLFKMHTKGQYMMYDLRAFLGRIKRRMT